MKTLLLDQLTWDLVIDSAGNIAAATDPYALAQNVANAARLFIGELWYNVDKGIPYFQEILGYNPPRGVIQEHLVRAAMSVTGVTSARVVILSISGRQLSGQIQFTDTNGNIGNASFN